MLVSWATETYAFCRAFSRLCSAGGFRREPIMTRRKPTTRRRELAPLPLFVWAASQAKPSRPLVRLIYMAGAVTAEGEQRVGLLIAGRAHPLAFPSLAAALARKSQLEAGR